jgi:hypothetical protein
MITVGLDFGTHQTKICIENATNKNQKTYDFFEFDLEGNKTYFLPSLIQICKNGKLNYGFIDENDVFTIKYDNPENLILYFIKPVLNLPFQPILKENSEIKPEKGQYPAEPIKAPYPKKQVEITFNANLKNGEKISFETNKKIEKKKWKDKCKKIDHNYYLASKAWKDECKKIDENYNNKLHYYQMKCESIKKENENNLDNWKEQCKQAEEKYKEENLEFEFKKKQLDYLEVNEKGEILNEKYVFKYFKFAFYSKEMLWKHQIDSEIICVWYLCNILFLLRKSIGEDFYLQIGIPCGLDKNEYKSQRNNAICILISAYKLLEKYGSHDEFINESYTDLLLKTEIVKSFTIEDEFFYGINAIPEAFAGLLSITQKRRLENGMNLLVDIGGGTTDIAFFTTTKNHMPDIHTVMSIPKGLNSISSNIFNDSILKKNKNYKKLDIYKDEIRKYQSELENAIKSIVQKVEKSFRINPSTSRLELSRLRNAMFNRPIIFAGGGATFKEIVRPYNPFTDEKIINENLLNFNSTKSKISSNLYPLLSTCYGLSIPLEIDEVILTDMTELFAHIAEMSQNDNSDGYEHGISDF